MEVEEGSPVRGGGECSESPTHIMEPHVEIDEEIDENSLEPKVELDEEIEQHVVEPHVEIDDGTEQNDGTVYPFDTLAVEYYEGAEDADSANTIYAEGESNDFHETNISVNGVSHDSEETSTDVAIHDNSQCNSGSVDDTSLDADDLTMDTSNSEAMDSSMLKEENCDPNYNEMQRTYLEDFFSSRASPSVDDSSNSSFERIPLSRFSTIVKVVERAEYETIQILYQLLYQRSAWDTQEILTKRILEFSGFNFGKSSEEYYNREMMLQTLPNSMLVKIGAILCLDQVKNVLSNVGLGRHDLINAILEFLALPRKKSRHPKISIGRSEVLEACGCRSNCLIKFTTKEREFLAQYHSTLRGKKKQDAYFLNLILVNKSAKRPGEDSKKHRDYKYSYKIKLGSKEIQVCKGGFMLLHNVKMSKLNQLQLKLKKGNFPKSELANAVYPSIEGEPEPEPTPEPVQIITPTEVKNEVSNEAPVSVEDSESTSSKPDIVNEDDDSRKTESEIKKKITDKVPAVVVEKIDPNNISAEKEREAEGKNADSSTKSGTSAKDDDFVRKKLREFPLVVKNLADVSEELSIDLHFLLFLKSAESDQRKENILEFDGFKFSTDTEEYDERNEFLQRMSGKLITDVARAFSLGVMSKREETIENILKFLMKPHESFLRTSASVPVILSDVELDDIEGMSDSDESITCEVVEKKVELIELLSSGDESEEPKKLVKSAQSSKKAAPTPQTPSTSSAPAASTSSSTSSSTTSSTTSEKGSSVVRCLRDFETIRKIVNTHPPEYLVDIYELLFLKKHEPATLRKEILDFTGFTFEKGTPEYVKRKQVLDRMLYNNVRRVYNTLIHNSTEVKVFSKPTMINEIFQFLFKLPDHDTSVRPLPPGAKTLMPKQNTASKLKTTVVTSAPTIAPTASPPASILPSQSGKLSDLKRVFQRVACFPCEYLVDVHKLLFMTDCDPKVIRQNIFAFKGFSFSVDSPDFQQRKMYLEYLTFHSLRKISSVLTTRSVDLRNSTKHELASHLTDVLAEYCNTVIETEAPTIATSQESQTTKTAPTTTTSSNSSSAENTVVTPVIESVKSGDTSSSTTKTSVSKPAVSSSSLGISIVETHSIRSPAVTSSPSPAKGSRKRKSQTVRQMVSDKKPAPSPSQPASEFADINLPEVEQYRQIYGANLNVYPNVPTITGIASFGSPVPQPFPHLVPQAMTFPIVSPYPQPLQVQGMQQPPQVLGLQSTAITMPTTNLTFVNKPTELILPAEIDNMPDEMQNKTKGLGDIPNSSSPSQDPVSKKQGKDSEEDGDKPLASLIGHPVDSVLEKQIRDLVENTDLQDITMNKVIQRIYNMYPKFDLSYRKEFIKSTLRTILYKLGDEKNQQSNKKENARDSNSPDCSVTTTDNRDDSLPASPEANLIVS